MRAACRVTACDYFAAFPVLAYGLLAIAILVGYGDFAHWPVTSSAHPTGDGFALRGPGPLILMFLPLIAAPMAALTAIAAALTAASDLLDASRNAWPGIIRSAAIRVTLSATGLALLTPVVGRILRWLID